MDSQNFEHAGFTSEPFPSMAPCEGLRVDSQQLYGCIKMLETMRHVLSCLEQELGKMCVNGNSTILPSLASSQDSAYPVGLPKLLLPSLVNTSSVSNVADKGGSPGSCAESPLAAYKMMRGGTSSSCFEFLSTTNESKVDDQALEDVVVDQIIVSMKEKQKRDDIRAYQKIISALPSIPQRKPGAGTKKKKKRTIGRAKPQQKLERNGMLSCCSCRNWKALHPDTTFQLLWSLIGLVFTMFCFLYIPAVMAFTFEPRGVFFKFVSVVDLYFIVDVPRAMFTGYWEQDELVMSPFLTLRRYAISWMIPDMVSAIPWEWIELPPGSSLQLTKALRCLRLLRLSKLLGLHRFGKTMQKFAAYVETKPNLIFAIGIARVLVLLFGITHYGACMWYYIGAHTNAEHTWVEKFLPEGAHAMRSYVYSVYFILTTMTTVGYGDMNAQNYTEVSFVLVLLFVASIVFAGLMGTLNDLILSLNNETRAIDEKKFTLSRYMQWRQVPRDLYLAIRQHLVFMWTSECVYQSFEEEIHESLPPGLRLELCHHIYGQELRSMPFLCWLFRYDICLKVLASKVKTLFMEFGDHIFKVGDVSEEVYILRIGKIHISQNESLFSEGPVTLSTTRSDPASETAAAFTTGIDSSVLCDAMALLNDLDEEEWKAARFVQTRWRFRQYLKKRWNLTEEIRERPRTHIPTSTVSAPAYFGEACLWVPLAEWGSASPMKHRYNARCASRCEMLCIPRAAIQDVIDSFSPWLGERFETFQESVLKGMGADVQGLSEMRNSKANPEPVNNCPTVNALQPPLLTPQLVQNPTIARDWSVNDSGLIIQGDMSDSLQEPLLGSAQSTGELR